MPWAAQRACPGGCGRMVIRGRCSSCSKRQEKKGGATAKGYTAAWEAFRVRFRHRLIARGIAPICGAALPEGPDMTASSRCKAEGVITADRLQLHHVPALTDEERKDPAAVCDERRVGWVCCRCHALETFGGR